MRRITIILAVTACLAGLLLAGEEKKSLSPVQEKIATMGRTEKLALIAALERKHEFTEDVHVLLFDNDSFVAVRAARATGRMYDLAPSFKNQLKLMFKENAETMTVPDMIGLFLAGWHNKAALMESTHKQLFGTKEEFEKLKKEEDVKAKYPEFELPEDTVKEISELLFAAGLHGDECPVDFAQCFLNSTTIELRRASAEAVGMAGKSGVKCLAGVVKLATDKDVAIRREVPLALMRMQMGLDATGDNAGTVKDAVEKILSLASDADDGVRLRLAYALRYLPNPNAKPALLKLLRDKNAFTRSSAAYALAGYKGGDARDVLIAALKDKSWLVAVAAIKALEKYPSTDTNTALLACLEKDNFHLRQAAIRAIGNLAAMGAKDSLRALLMDDCPAVRAEAAVALARIFKKDALPHVQVLLADDNYTARIGLARACAIVKHDDSLVMLKRLWDAVKDNRVRASVLAALYEIGDKSGDTWSIVKGALAVDDFVVRHYAITMLSESKETWALDSIRSIYGDLVAKRGANDELRLAIVGIVKRHAESGADKEDVKLLEKALADPAFKVRSLAAEALEIAVKKKCTIAPDAEKENILEPGKDFPLEAKRDLRIEIKTTRGKMVAELFTADAPRHVTRTIELINKKFYNGLTWHRVENNYVIQGGCPWGNGCGGAGFNLPLEINRRRFERGTVGMARGTDRDSGSCQMFICHSPQPKLDGRYTAYGRVVVGLDVIDKIQQGDKIISIKIVE